MPAQTYTQARGGISPVNTTIAQGYQNNEFVGSALFPRVGVGVRAGKIITFSKEQFRQYANMQRSPGARTPRVQFGYGTADYALTDYSIEGTLPKEIREEQLSPAKGFTIDGATMAINNAMDIIGLRLEIEQATLATTLNNYDSSNRTTLSGTAQFSDYSGTSNPVKAVEDGKEAIRQQIGKRPNTLVMGPTVFAAIKQHPVILDRIKYTGRDVATTDLLASLFGVPNIYVGEAVKASDADVFSDIWGKHMVLAYTELGSLAERGRPSFGYTYNLNGYPMSEPAYYEDNEKTWCFPVSSCEQPVIAAKSAGYFIQNAVA
jgi:hypothetical protein